MGEGKLPILGFTLTQHLTGFQAGNPKAVKVSRKYQRQMDRREEKMEQFAKGELSRADYLREMGAISLKADKAASRMLVEEGEGPPGLMDMDSDDSHDSLSETRPLPRDSDETASEEEFVFSKPSEQPKVGAKKTSGSKKNGLKQLCPVCKKGFQLRRDPPLHLACSICGKFTHKRCIKNMHDPFLCTKCSPTSEDLVPDIVSPSSPAAAAQFSALPCPPRAPRSTAATVAPRTTSAIGAAATGAPRTTSATGASRSTVPSASLNLTETCCDELLLSEGEIRFSCLPSYQGSERKFDERMRFLGFERSPSQPCTLGDGNCGVYALLDQLNLTTSEELPMFERDDALFARYVERF